MTFPTTRLGLQVEIAMAGPVDPVGDPTLWPWADVSDRLLAQGIGFSRGQENEAQGLQPATATFELSTRDGLLLPSNPASTYWPYFRRGTPVRITTEGAPKAAWLPGGLGGYWSSPHRSQDNISGDIDIRIYMHPDRWSDPQGGWNQYLCGIGGTTDGSRQWRLAMRRQGTITLDLSSDGITYATQIWSTSSFIAQRPTWLGITLDANTGAGQLQARMYRWEGDTPPADITTWEKVEDIDPPQETVAIHTGSTSDLVVGADHAGRSAMRGRFYALQVRNGINGTLVASPDFAAQAVGTTSFNDSTGRTWTRHGTAEISTRFTRFSGTVDAIVVRWPYGNHNAAVEDIHPSECRVVVTVSDLVRRLGQGAQPLKSPLRRRLGVPANYPARHIFDPAMAAYWPCEDPQGAVALGSGVPAGTAIQAYNVQAGSGGNPMSSEPVAFMPGDAPSSWVGEVDYFDPVDGWEVGMIFRGEEGPADPPQCRLFEVRCGGTVDTWQVALTSAGYHLRGWAVGVEVVSVDAGYPTANWGPWMHVQLDMYDPGGGDVFWGLGFTNLDTGAATSTGGTFAGVIGTPTQVSNSLLAADAPKGLSFGHVYVSPRQDNVGWLNSVATGWVGETAAHRIWRLGYESDITVEVVGDPTLGFYAAVTSLGRGDMGWSQPLGYQHQDTLLALLDQAAAVDRGHLSSRTTHPGFVYRTRATLDNQPVRLVLDATTNAVTIPLEPTLDDQRIRNDVTVSCTNGASARETDEASITAEGRYEVGVEVNGVAGVFVPDFIVGAQPGLDLAMAYQAHHLAGWLLALGTQTDMRFPRIVVDFSLAPATLLAQWSQLALGDRIQLTGLPAQFPGTVELIVEYMEDLMSPTAWIGVLVGSPGAPYMMGVLDA